MITAIHPYLHFAGNCEEAFAHYAKVLGATNTGIFRYADMPPEPEGTADDDGCGGPIPADFGNKVMNTTLQLGEMLIMGSDAPPGMGMATGGFTVSVQVTDEAEADRIFAALMEGGGKIDMPIGETFWAKRFGMGTDRFGTPWMVNCSKDMPA